MEISKIGNEPCVVLGRYDDQKDARIYLTKSMAQELINQLTSFINRGRLNPPKNFKEIKQEMPVNHEIRIERSEFNGQFYLDIKTQGIFNYFYEFGSLIELINFIPTHLKEYYGLCNT